MAFKDDLVNYLASKTAITDIVTTDANRIRQGWTPQATAMPYITISIQEFGHEHVLTGGAGFSEPDVEIQLWCDRESQRQLLSAAVRSVLQGYRGTMGSTVVKCVTLPLDNEFEEPPRDNSQKIIFRRVMQFKFSIDESIPTYA